MNFSIFKFEKKEKKSIIYKFSRAFNACPRCAGG